MALPRIVFAGLGVIVSASACNQLAGIDAAHLIEEPKGGGPPCLSDANCNDENPCTADTCPDGFCLLVPLEATVPKELAVAGDCTRVVCHADEATAEIDDADLPIDGATCTEDLCDAGAASNPPLSVGKICNEDGGAICDGDGACVGCLEDAACTPPETCGGSGVDGFCGCKPTTCAASGLTCGFGADDGCGKPLACNNAKKDGGETDLDCGGPPSSCAVRCAAGKGCFKNSDCASRACDERTKVCI
ncbi:MAG: hypothetical protein EXR75_03300 [Myxococcales bacterium]|nr:hypothetical protein [Myxococcales bacterium]